MAPHDVIRWDIYDAGYWWICWRMAWMVWMTYINSPSPIGVLLMVLVYRTGGNGEENFNEITMANVLQESKRSVASTNCTLVHFSIEPGGISGAYEMLCL